MSKNTYTYHYTFSSNSIRLSRALNIALSVSGFWKICICLSMCPLNSKKQSSSSEIIEIVIHAHSQLSWKSWNKGHRNIKGLQFSTEITHIDDKVLAVSLCLKCNLVEVGLCRLRGWKNSLIRFLATCCTRWRTQALSVLCPIS